jgi:hypothetical protein
MYFRVRGDIMFLVPWFFMTRIFTFVCKNLKLYSFVIGNIPILGPFNNLSQILPEEEYGVELHVDVQK